MTYDAPRMRVVARDPQTLYVFWDGVEEPAGHTWEVRAEAPGGAVLATALSPSRDAWLSVPVASVARVSVRAVGAAAALLSAVLSAAPSPAAPPPLPSSSSRLAAP